MNPNFSNNDPSLFFTLSVTLSASLPPFPIPNVHEYIVDVYRFDPVARSWTEVKSVKGLRKGDFPYSLPGMTSGLYTIRVDYISSTSGLRRTLSHHLQNFASGKRINCNSYWSPFFFVMHPIKPHDTRGFQRSVALFFSFAAEQHQTPYLMMLISTTLEQLLT